MASVFVAAGVAAALAASLTGLVVPIDAARANPPTSNVIVVNPATGPALARNVDDPGRIAYQSTAACVLDSNFCGFDFPAVPKNHRLVVEHVSGSLFGNATGAQVSLSGGANQAASSFLAPPSFQGASQFDQPVLQYFDAGSAPFWARKPTPLSSRFRARQYSDTCSIARRLLAQRLLLNSEPGQAN